MHKLNEEEDNKFLTSKENAEEIAQSVDYDVCRLPLLPPIRLLNRHCPE